MKNKRVLLISNSTLYGSGYLDHAAAEICDFFHSVKSVLFIPYALYDRDAYTSLAQKRFVNMGFELSSIHTASDPAQSSMKRRLCSSGVATPFAF